MAPGQVVIAAEGTAGITIPADAQSVTIGTDGVVSVKLPGQANRFYEGSISEHLQIGIHAIDLLRAEGSRLHSRKLRAFDEPPFR